MGEKEPRKSEISRRGFLKRGAIIVGGFLAAGSAGLIKEAGAGSPRTPETTTWREDVWVTGIDADPRNSGKFICVALNPSSPLDQIYEGLYHPVTKEFKWREIASLPGLIASAYGAAISPADNNTWAVGGAIENQTRQGFLKITRNNGGSFQEINPLPSDIGSVQGLDISPDGQFLYLFGYNPSYQLRFAKYEIATGNRISLANNGWASNERPTRLVTSPNFNETLYVSTDRILGVIHSQDGGQNWSELFRAPNPVNDFLVVNWQGQDALITAGTGWIRIQIGSQSPIWDYRPNFTAIGVDNTTDLKLYGAVSTNSLYVRSLSEANWRVFPTTGLPPNLNTRSLKFLTTPDGEKWLTVTVYHMIDDLKASGFWAYRLSQGETSGTWQQMVMGIPDRTDINRNGCTDIIDFSRLRICFGKSASETDPRGNPCSLADLDGNGWVNILDFSRLRNRFGKCWR